MTDEEKAREEKQLKYIEFLVKENKDLQHRLDVAQGFLDRDVEYIEMCKAVKENAELKALIEEQEKLIETQYVENQTLGNNNGTLIHRLGELSEQIEKMKNFNNCAHSSRALCPNEHNCKNCKEWEMEE